MTLSHFTAPGLMLPRLRGGGVASVIQELSEALEAESRVPDAASICRAALERESMGGTEMEAGMAFPHARVEGLKGVTFALGRSVQPLRWGHSAAPTVRLVFLLAVPASDVTEYLLLISGLARLSRDAGLMHRLIEGSEAAQMFEVLTRVGVSGSAGAGLARTEAT